MSKIVLVPIDPSEVGSPPAGYKTLFMGVDNRLYVKSEVGLVEPVYIDSHPLYTHIQTMASTVWLITHNLSTHPTVTVVDSAGTKVYGDVIYVDQNTVRLEFSAPFGGKAYLVSNIQTP